MSSDVAIFNEMIIFFSCSIDRQENRQNEDVFFSLFRTTVVKPDFSNRIIIKRPRQPIISFLENERRKREKKQSQFPFFIPLMKIACTHE